MQVILKETLDNLGTAGAIVNVKDGHARNYLFPRNLAAPATTGLKNQIAHLKMLGEKRRLRELKTAEDLRDRIQSTELVILARAGSHEKLFGSITTANIADALAAQGVEIARKKIVLEHSIRELGTHMVQIRIDPQVSAELKVVIQPSADSRLDEVSSVHSSSGE